MKTYTISEIAKIMHVAPSAIRYYDAEGLLPMVQKVNGRRVFTDEDFRWLKVLNCMKDTGMPIKEIRKYVDLAQQGDETLAERYEIIMKQKASLNEQIAALQKNLKILEYKEWYYETAIAAGTEAVHQGQTYTPSLEPDEIPE